ncbi:MAG: HNH endonuclease [Chloroflexi bacterium]|nr:MAG: HNH endonuclease [Chloroflexota bacterium]
MPYADPEKRREYGREWMKRNPDKARAAMRRWRRRHPEVHAARTRARYARDPERFRQSIEASPNRAAVRRAMHERRRARALGAGPSFTAAEWTALVAANGNRCAYDGAPGPLHADHRLPLARGGTNEIQNILPACARCNLRKHLMTEEEFRSRLAAERDEASARPESRDQVEEHGPE